MIKLFEPFQPKINLHIDNRFLQSLWDKYVPRTSENYDRISLIYLKGIPGADSKPGKQVNLLVNLVLKNIFMQMNLSQNPMLLNQTSISGSVKHLSKIYLNELKKMDFQLYKSLDQYAVYLERAEKEEIRYREWTKENRVITQMHREYHVLQEVSRRLEELTSVRSVQLGRKYGKTLFRSLDKKEYKILSEAFLWEEKRQVEEYIQNCSEEQYLRIRKLLDNKPKLCTLLKENDRPEDITERVPPADIPRVVSKEQLLTLVRTYGQKDFRRFCHQVLFQDMERDKEYHGLLQAGILWEKDKKEIYQQFKRMNAEELHHFWEEIPLLTAKICRVHEEEYAVHQEDLQQKGHVLHPEVLMQEGHIVHLTNLQQEQQTMQSGKESRLRYRICRKFSDNLEKVQKKYVTEIKEYIQNVVLCPEKQDEYEIIKNTVDIKTVFEEDSVLVYGKPEGEEKTSQEAADFSLISNQPEAGLTVNQIFRDRIDQMQRILTEHLKVQEQRIVQREQHVLDAYKDIFVELLAEKDLSSEHRPSQRLTKNLVDVDIEETFRQKYGTKKLSEIFIQKLKGWSEAILSFSEQGQEKSEARQFRQQIQISKDKTELRRLVEELTLNMDNGEKIAESDSDTRAIQSTQDASGRTILVYREEQIQNPQIQELLQYLHQLKEEERREFVRQLADMVLIQKQMDDGNKTVKQTDDENTAAEQAADRNHTVKTISPKNNLSKSFIEKLESWSSTLLSFTEEGQEKTQTELLQQQIQISKDKAELQRLIVELSHYVDDEDGKGNVESDIDTEMIPSMQVMTEKPLLVYRDEQIRNPKIQGLLQYLRQVKGAERREFIRQLGDMILIQKRTTSKKIDWKQNQQESTFDSQRKNTHQYIEKEKTVKEIFRKKYDKYHLSKSFIQNLESWSNALLVFTEEGQEKTQTELLQPSMQVSKDKAELQRLIVELSHDLDDEDGKGNVESDIDTEMISSMQIMAEKPLLVYRDEQIQNPKIQGLLKYLRQVKEAERREFIRQLGDMILIQKQTTSRNIAWKQNQQENTFDSQRKNTHQYIEENTAKEIFRQKYDKYHFSKPFIQNLESWSNALLVLMEEGQEKTQTELLREQIQASKDKVDFQRLAVQLAHYIKNEEEKQEIHADAKAMQSMQDRAGSPLFVYREEQLRNVKIQELLQHLRQVKEAERQEVIRQLADMIILQKQTNAAGGLQKQFLQKSRIERQQTEAFQDVNKKTAEEVFWEKYEKRNLSKTFIEKLESWSQALLNVTEQEQEKSQTDLLRQQIQTSKDKADFQRLAVQLAHYMEEEKENRENYADSQAGKLVQDMSKIDLLVYREEQLRDVKIQELLQHLRQIKEEERPEVVRQLAGMIMIQKQTGRTNEANIQKEADLQDEEKNFSIENLHTQMAHRRIETVRHRTELRHLIMQMKYSELADRIQVYEERRKKIREAETDRMKTIYTDIIETALQSEESKVQEAGRLHRISAHPGQAGPQDIKFVFPEETLSGRMQNNNTEIQKETLQVRSLQQHMDVRLREVERQLQKKADSHPGTSDDIRTIAEKVKKQLHEELHMERLRRGLV